MSRLVVAHDFPTSSVQYETSGSSIVNPICSVLPALLDGNYTGIHIEKR